MSFPITNDMLYVMNCDFKYPPPPCFTPSSAPDERFLLVRTSGLRLGSSLWLACWGPELWQSLPVYPLLYSRPRLWLAVVLCGQRWSWHDVGPCWCWRRGAGALSWLCCPASPSGWDSSRPWSGPPVAACNSLCECCLSLTVSAWNTSHTHDKWFLILWGAAILISISNSFKSRTDLRMTPHWLTPSTKAASLLLLS